MSVHLAKRQSRFLPKACALLSHRLLRKSNHSFWSTHVLCSETSLQWRCTGQQELTSGIHSALEFFWDRVSSSWGWPWTPDSCASMYQDGLGDRYVPPCLVYVASVPYTRYSTNPVLTNLRFWGVIVCSVILHFANFFATPTFGYAIQGCDPQFQELGLWAPSRTESCCHLDFTSEDASHSYPRTVKQYICIAQTAKSMVIYFIIIIER